MMMFPYFPVVNIAVFVFISRISKNTEVLRVLSQEVLQVPRGFSSIESARGVAERVHLTAENHLGPLVPRKFWYDLETYEGFQMISNTCSFHFNDLCSETFVQSGVIY